MIDLHKLEERFTELSRELRELKQRSPDRGRWWLGDETSTDELIYRVLQVISGPKHRARTLAQLEELIGASRSRISGAIVRLQVQGHQVQNLGSKYRALWWIPTSKK